MRHFLGARQADIVDQHAQADRLVGTCILLLVQKFDDWLQDDLTVGHFFLIVEATHL